MNKHRVLRHCFQNLTSTFCTDACSLQLAVCGLLLAACCVLHAACCRLQAAGIKGQFVVQSTLFSKCLRACLFLSTDFESLARADEALLSVAGSSVQLAASCSLQAARCMLHAACGLLHAAGFSCCWRPCAGGRLAPRAAQSAAPYGNRRFACVKSVRLRLMGSSQAAI